MADVTIGQLNQGTPDKNSAVIPYSDGTTTLRTAPSGIVAASPGCLLQVKQAIRTSVYSLINGNTWEDVPNITVTITPRTLSSKFLLSWTAGASTSLRWGQGTVGLLLKFVRTMNNVSEDVGVGDSRGGDVKRCTAGCLMVDWDYIANISGVYLDSPTISNLTTPITYKMQAFKDGTTYDQMLGGSYRTSYVGDASCPTILTIQEIAG